MVPLVRELSEQGTEGLVGDGTGGAGPPFGEGMAWMIL